MLSKTMQDAINEQIKNEFYSAYLYLSMSAYFESINMPGSAKWMRTQFGEEQTHGLKMFDFIHDRGGRIALKAIDAPAVDFASPVAVWEMVLAHEQKVTGLINKLYAQAVTENDYASQTFLTWFITEQVEEEQWSGELMSLMEQFHGHPGQLFMLDHQWGKRVKAS